MVISMKFVLSGAFGELSPVRDGRVHNGIDIAMPEGTELRSVCEGVVKRVVDYGNNNIGKGVIIQSNDGNYHIFGHMSKVTVHKGQTVHDGSFIGLSGNTGHSTGPHLHFGIQGMDGHFIDPTNYYDHLVALTGKHGAFENIYTTIIDNGTVNHHSYGGGDGGAVDSFMNHLSSDLSHWCAVKMHEFHDWFTWALPDIVGYIGIFAGLSIALFSIFNTKWVKRTIGGYTATLIGSLMYLTYN
jgi:hypothetical protein